MGSSLCKLCLLFFDSELSFIFYYVSMVVNFICSLERVMGYPDICFWMRLSFK
jgi:hypothetical protein